MDSSKRSKVGSVKKLDSGKYLVRVSNGFKRDGKRNVLSATADTEREAELLRMQLAVQAGKMPNLGDDMTLSEYYHTLFVPGCKTRNLAKATLKRYDGCWKRSIEPAFGNRGMSTIRHAEIQALVYRLPHYEAKHVAATLRAILRSAWDDDLLDIEPMRHRLRFPQNERPQRGVWSAETVAAALPLMEGLPIEALWLCMVGGGLRQEEAYALYWSDIDIEELAGIHGENRRVCTVTVDDAVTVDDGRKSVKTDFSKRIVVISEPFASRLHDLKGCSEDPICPIRVDGVSRAWAKMWQEPKYRKDGKPYGSGNPAYTRGKMLLAGIPYIQLSRMRATHETIIQSAGIADTLNARMHGRSQASNVGYTNYLNPDTQAYLPAAEALGAAVNNAKAG